VVPQVRGFHEERAFQGERSDRREALENPQIRRPRLLLQQHRDGSQNGLATGDGCRHRVPPLDRDCARCRFLQRPSHERTQCRVAGLTFSTLGVTLLVNGDHGHGTRPEGCLDFLGEAVEY
jgi:hypothetical protein